MTRRRGGMEVLPFGGRGFLRVHGHERCLLAARWPRDHRRRRNRTESCCFSLSLFLTLLSLSLSAVCLERRGLLPPLLLLLLVLFPPPLPPLSVSLVLLLRGEEKDGGRDSGERRGKKKRAATVQCTIWLNVCVCLRQRVCVRADSREQQCQSGAPPHAPASFLPPFPSFLPSPLSPCLSLFHFPCSQWGSACVFLFTLFPSSLVSLVELADELNTQALDPQCVSASVYVSLPSSSLCLLALSGLLQLCTTTEPRASWSVPLCAQAEGCRLVTATGKLMPFSLRCTLLPLFPSEFSLSRSLSLPLTLSLSSNCLITTSCISGQRRTDLPCSPPPLLSIWHPPLLFSKKTPFHLCLFRRLDADVCVCVCVCVCVFLSCLHPVRLYFSRHLSGQMGLLLHEWTAHREVARGCCHDGGLSP